MSDSGRNAELVAITVGEAARRLSCSIMTVRRLIDRRELHVVRLGRSVRVLAASIDRLAARGGWRMSDLHPPSPTPPGPTSGPAVLRIPETAARLGISIRSVQRLLHLGELDRVKIGRPTRIPVASVEKFIKKGGAPG